jgi:hypothetical protein
MSRINFGLPSTRSMSKELPSNMNHALNHLDNIPPQFPSASSFPKFLFMSGHTFLHSCHSKTQPCNSAFRPRKRLNYNKSMYAPSPSLLPNHTLYCVPTVPSLFDAIFFMKPLNFPPPLPPPPSSCEPDIAGPEYGCFPPGIGGTGGASWAGGLGRDAKFCVSISARPASMIAWFLA